MTRVAPTPESVLRDRLDRRRSMARTIDSAPSSSQARIRREVCDEACAILAPLGWLLPYSLTELLTCYAAHPRSVKRRIALFDRLASAAQSSRDERTVGPRSRARTYSIAALTGANTPCVALGRASCGATAAFVVGWTWRRGKRSRQVARGYCLEHARGFAKAHGLECDGLGTPKAAAALDVERGTLFGSLS